LGRLAAGFPATEVEPSALLDSGGITQYLNQRRRLPRRSPLTGVALSLATQPELRRRGFTDAGMRPVGQPAGQSRALSVFAGPVLTRWVVRTLSPHACTGNR